MRLAPVILFTFNRPEHTKKTLDTLSLNDLANKTNLYIFSDGAQDEIDEKNVKLVRVLLNKFKNSNSFLSVHVFESDINKGLAKSVIEGVTRVFLEYDSVIVLEDDLLTSNDFLKFMNNSLDKYRSEDNIGCITGYNPLRSMPNNYKFDIYFSNRSSSLGWGTWKRVWDNVDWSAEEYHKFKISYKKRLLFNAAGFDRANRLDRQIKKDAKSWSILFGFDNFIKKKLTVYAKDSKIIHIGWDGTGTHSNVGISEFNDQHKVSFYPLKFPNEISLNKDLLKHQQNLFGGSIIIKVKDFLIFIKNLIS